MSLDALLNDLPKTLEALRSEVRQLRSELRAAQQPEKLSYNLKEGAHAMGLSYEKVYAMVKSGELRSSQTGPGGSYVIARRDINDWIDTHAIAGGEPIADNQISLQLTGAAKKIINKNRFSREQL